MKIHKSYTCDICANIFTENGHLKIHILGYTCDIGDNIFTKNGHDNLCIR